MATLNSKNLIVYGQNHKVWALVERVENFETKLSRFGEIFSFATKSQSPQQLQEYTINPYVGGWVIIWILAKYLKGIRDNVV